MKKTPKYQLAALKKFIVPYRNRIIVFLCAFFSLIFAFNFAAPAFEIATTEELNECKQELVSYLSSPSRYALNTTDYTLKIKGTTYTLSSTKNSAICTATLDETTNDYTYSVTAQALTSIVACILFTIVFAFAGTWILLGILVVIADTCTKIAKHIKEFQSESRIIRAETELRISREDAIKYEQSLILKEAYDKAQGNGYNDGYTKGREKGYKRGQLDAYDEGYAKGFADGQDELFASIHTFLKPQSDDKIYEETNL